MAEFNTLGFAFVGIKTDQFAIIDEAYKKTGPLKITTNLSYGINEVDKTIAVEVGFNFIKKETPFLIIGVQAFFEITKEGWEKIYNVENKQVVIPKKLISHLTVLTIGTTRGILHAKTEGTPYNSIILPTVNVNDLVTEDVTINLAK